MPIQVLWYKVKNENEVWQQERHGSRFVAKCASKAMAKRVAKLLNGTLPTP